jgi:hypothetical protein
MALASKLELLSGAQSGLGVGVGTQAQQVPQAQQALLQLQQGEAGVRQAVMVPGASAAPQNAELEAQLSAMAAAGGGVIQGWMPQSADGVSGRPMAPGAKGLGQARVPGGTAQAGLSGAEFLSTLGAAKGAIGMLGEGSQFQGGQGEGNDAAMSGGKPSLRMIQGGAKGGKAGFDNELTLSQSVGNLVGQHVAPGAGNGLTAMAGGTGLAAEVTGYVTKGANAEDRLSSESLTGITSSLRGITTQGTGGEMRIRLKPENLGELHVRVMTDGRNVGLQIQATDEKAKRIIEESLSHLKESMAAQNLSLGAVDFTVGHMQGSSQSGDGAFQGNQHQQGQSGLAGDWLSQQGGGNQKAHGQSLFVEKNCVPETAFVRGDEFGMGLRRPLGILHQIGGAVLLPARPRFHFGGRIACAIGIAAAREIRPGIHQPV